MINNRRDNNKTVSFRRKLTNVLYLLIFILLVDNTILTSAFCMAIMQETCFTKGSLMLIYRIKNVLIGQIGILEVYS